VNILFAVSHLGFLRNFESTLAQLAERGHHVHIITDRKGSADVLDSSLIVDRLTDRFPAAFTVDALPASRRHTWYGFANVVRAALDYWRYLHPRYDNSPKLRARARQNAGGLTVWLSDRIIAGSARGRRLVTSCFRTLEAVVPVRPEVQRLFESNRFDLLVVTPLLYFGSTQVDYVRCARRRGINSVLGVGSWDHLTTKGSIHEPLDRVLVWNELQKVEAEELHGIPPDRVTVTGAQAYDHWFTARPYASREEFCARVGLPADRPYLLYLCSSPFIAPNEVGFVKSWIAAVRASGDPVLREAGILLRPHPQNASQWADVDLSASPNAVIWPRAGANPISPAARSEYYDSMYHSHAVVGLNTSALIESGIVGRLVYSIRTSEFSGTQEGTLHFHHLRRGGLLQLADTLPEHVAHLQRSFDDVERDRARIREFVKAFVRPHGLDEVATSRVVGAIEDAGRQAARPMQLTAAQHLLQAAIGLLLWVSMAPEVLWRLATTSTAEVRNPTWWWSMWRHATRPVRQTTRRSVKALNPVVRAANRRGRALRRGLAEAARRAERVPAHALRAGRRAVARTRVRLGEVKRRISSSDTTA
jgi:hypothetical protein